MPGLNPLLDAPIRWKAAATDPDLRDLLEDLQANILKGHGRHHAAHLFLSFKGMTPDAVAEVVRTLGRYCTSAYAQLRTNKRYPPHLDGGPVRCLFLSAGGYTALGGHATMPAGAAFAAGMAARQSILNDPPRAAWDKVGWRDHAPDAMFLVANADAAAVTRDLEDVEGWLNGTGVRILVIERGLQQTRQFRPNAKPEGVEHFGYVDGRSQPLFLEEDLEPEEASVAAEPRGAGDTGAPWSPRFKPSQFIVADPNGRRSHSAGSYFVFRKLEQDVRGFNKAEDDLGKALFGANATQVQLDRAGAMVVGRFEDGTPLVLHPSEQEQAVPNGFTYAGDPDGAKCPFHAHIRKTNPRGDIQRELNLPDNTGDRKPIMARRGITYGAKRPMSKDGREFDDAGREPVHDSGLLFMAYMADLEAQFEFTQQSWADNPDFVGNLNAAKGRPPTGVDPVIGQTGTASQRQHTYLDGHTQGASPSVQSFAQFVHMKGGEYFFAPSLSFLRGVGL
ncbi:hypothetical protein E2C06_07215 [Dankookia rubra]|uniref:Peroxidase n=1 Tax=Dankookia rubra TaxID=1442381 RepID=A0A4R5QJC6_9PROT|nr:hypothetical protein [Dankookia rubra]TDH63163.1 hypothetical protein E2C06_07215 [Dankookia rubra]